MYSDRIVCGEKKMYSDRIVCGGKKLSDVGRNIERGGKDCLMV